MNAATWSWVPPLGELEEPSEDDGADWVIRDLIPRGEPWMLAGRWKSGKSWTGLSLLIATALGRNWLNFEHCLGRPGRALLFSLEDSRRWTERQLWELCRGFSTTPNDPVIQEHLRISYVRPTLPGNTDPLVEELARWAPDVVLFDSLSRVMRGNQNSIDDAARFTAAWQELGGCGAAVGFQHHTNKGWAGSDLPTLDEIRGSGDLVAFPRHIVMMKRQEGAPRSVVAMVGNRDVSRDAFVLEYRRTETNGHRVSSYADLGDRTHAKEQRAAERAAKKAASAAALLERRLEALTLAENGGVSAALLARAADIASSTAGKLLTELRGEKLISGNAITDAGRAFLYGNQRSSSRSSIPPH